jgi:hypothetical protein
LGTLAQVTATSPETHTPAVVAALTGPERELLELLAEDGWPLLILRDRAGVQPIVLSLLQLGLVEVYGRPDDARAVPRAKADAILGAPESWDPSEGQTSWMICASPAGNALLESDP